MSKKFKIFIAGSKALDRQRMLFRAVLSKMQNLWGVTIEARTFEDFPNTLNKNGRQTDYNKYIAEEADVVAFIYNDKVGNITQEEFDIAYNNFCKNGRPEIIVYANKSNDEQIVGLKAHMNELHQYFVEYADDGDLMQAFMEDINEYLVNHRDKFGDGKDGYTDIDYVIGVQAFWQYDLQTALDYLLELSLDNHRKAQQYVAMIAGKTCRAKLVDSKQWKSIVEPKAAEGNSFAQYMMSQYYGFCADDMSLEERNKMNFTFANESAKHGDAYGLFALAKCYDLGIGTEKNAAMYNKNIRESCAKGCCMAIPIRAAEYITGWNGRRSLRYGMTLMEQGLKHDNPRCYAMMGRFYRKGQYIERDFAKAEEYLLKSIELGWFESYVDMYLLYADEQFPKYDLKLAYDFLQTGVLRKEPHCIATIGDLFFKGKLVAQSYKKAIAYYKRAQRYNVHYACSRLADIYYNGLDVEPDKQIAWNWLQKGAAYFEPNSLYYLGLMCLRGEQPDNVEQNECISYFEKASIGTDDNSSKALECLYRIFATEQLENGCKFEVGEFMKPENHPWAEKDDERAFRYLRQAAEMEKSSDVLYRCGMLMTKTDGIHSSDILGIKYLERALELGHINAAKQLARIYSEGKCIPKDDEKAEYYKNL